MILTTVPRVRLPDPRRIVKSMPASLRAQFQYFARFRDVPGGCYRVFENGAAVKDIFIEEDDLWLMLNKADYIFQMDDGARAPFIAEAELAKGLKACEMHRPLPVCN